MKKIILTIMLFMTLSVFSFSVNAEVLDSSVSESSTTSDVSQDESSSSDAEGESSKNESKDPFDGYILIGQIMEKENSISGTLSNLGMLCIGVGIFGIVAVILWSVLSAMAYKKKQKELEKAKQRKRPNGKKRKRPVDGQVRRKRPIENIESESTVVVPTEEIQEPIPAPKNTDKYDTQEILKDFLNS